MKLHTPSLIAFLISCASIAPVSGQTLQLHYTYDSQGNPTADTGVGTAANGTLVGTGNSYTTNTPSGTGYAYSSNGASSYINAGDANKLDGLTGLTFSTWINLQTMEINPDRLVSKEGASSGFFALISNPNTTAHTFNLSVSFNGVTSSPTAVNYTLNAYQTWLFVAFTYDATISTNNLKVYSGTTSSAVSLVWTASNAGGTNNSGSIVANSSAFDINSASGNGADRSVNGFFDDTRVYSGVLDLAALDAVRLTQVSAVPEPSTYALWFGGFAVCAAVYVRRGRREVKRISILLS